MRPRRRRTSSSDVERLTDQLESTTLEAIPRTSRHQTSRSSHRPRRRRRSISYETEEPSDRDYVRRLTAGQDNDQYYFRRNGSEERILAEAPPRSYRRQRVREV